jgi:protein CLEC16A
LIQFDYNFYDEEMVDMYVSFIKSVALCLNENSIQFFYNAKMKHFPLLLMAQRFANHPETMVRNAVRIINLTVFKINDRKLNNELLSDVPYCLSFVHLACLLRDKVCNGLDQAINCNKKPYPKKTTLPRNPRSEAASSSSLTQA